MLKGFYIFLLTIVFASNALASDKANISISFEPNELALGRRGLLTITVSGIKGTTAPKLPEIDGLTIRPLGTQQNVQVINGNTSIAFTYSFTVTPQKAGEFMLPNFDWDINGKKYSVSSPKTKLIVHGQDAKIDKDDTDSIELKIDITKNKVFVGQMIPLTLFLYAPANTLGSITTFPKIEGNDFIGYDYKENPKVTIETIGDIQKQVMPFKTYISPLKSGNHPLQYKMGLAIQRPRTVAQNSAGTNNLFESIFGNMMIINNTEEIELTSVPEIINVAPLPIYGKPENFSGAIGDFHVEPLSISQTNAQVGEPITLTMTIKGSGNLDRISPPVLNLEGNWKVYTPKSTLNKEDHFGFTGSKAFEYIIIPQNEKITATPPIIFSFFNPTTGLYSELTPSPIALTITAPSESFKQSNISHTPIKQKDETPNLTEPELLPIKLEIKKSVRTLTPPMTKIFFTPSLLAITVTLGAILVLIKKQKTKNSKNAEYLKQIHTEKAIRSNLQNVRKAYARHNAEDFYHSASMTLIEIVAKQHAKPAQALHLQDIVNFFKEKGLSQEFINYIETIFQMADVLKFSGVSKEQNLTEDSLKNFELLINELEKCC